MYSLFNFDSSRVSTQFWLKLITAPRHVYIAYGTVSLLRAKCQETGISPGHTACGTRLIIIIIEILLEAHTHEYT